MSSTYTSNPTMSLITSHILSIFYLSHLRIVKKRRLRENPTQIGFQKLSLFSLMISVISALKVVTQFSENSL